MAVHLVGAEGLDLVVDIVIITMDVSCETCRGNIVRNCRDRIRDVRRVRTADTHRNVVESMHDIAALLVCTIVTTIIEL